MNLAGFWLSFLCQGEKKSTVGMTSVCYFIFIDCNSVLKSLKSKMNTLFFPACIFLIVPRKSMVDTAAYSHPACEFRPATNDATKTNAYLPLTSVCLSVGDDLARTRNLGQTLSIRSCSTWTQEQRVMSCFLRVNSIMLRQQRTSPFSLRILLLNSLPSMQRKSSPGWMMPHLMAMALAVLMLSPVTMRTVMPACWHFRMASGTYRSSRATDM